MARSSTSFQSGQSGNPNGRPPKRRDLDDLLDDVFKPAQRRAILKRLISDAESGDLDCIKLLLAYAYGKPVERKEISGPDGASIDIAVTEVIIERPLQSE